MGLPECTLWVTQVSDYCKVFGHWASRCPSWVRRAQKTPIHVWCAPSHPIFKGHVEAAIVPSERYNDISIIFLHTWFTLGPQLLLVFERRSANCGFSWHDSHNKTWAKRHHVCHVFVPSFHLLSSSSPWSAQAPFHSLCPQGFRRYTKRTGLPSSNVSSLSSPFPNSYETGPKEIKRA